MKTADYLALPKQEQWAIVEEHIFEVVLLRIAGKVRIIPGDPLNGWEGLLECVKNDHQYLHGLEDRDEPNGWWEIVLEMERRGYSFEITNPVIWTTSGNARIRNVTFALPSKEFEAAFFESGQSVRVAALRAIQFLED